MASHVPTQHDYEMLAEFRATLRRFLAFSEAEARAAGLTPRQHQALLAIKGAPRNALFSIGNLAERLQLHHNSTVGLVDRLEERGLLERVPDKTDRRRVWLKLSREGGSRLASLSAVHLAELRRIRPALRRLLDRPERVRERTVQRPRDIKPPERFEPAPSADADPPRRRGARSIKSVPPAKYNHF